MLVTFKTKRYSNITMFGDVAVRLLQLMGHSGTVPGAISAADVPAALARLRAGLADHGKEVVGQKRDADDDRDADEDDDDRKAPKIDLAHRAVPLLELLESAIANEADVMWSD
jgi:hypothetical protein